VIDILGRLALELSSSLRPSVISSVRNGRLSPCS